MKKQFIDKLLKQIYPQPEDAGHTAWTEEAIGLLAGWECRPERVLDVGCGTGFAAKYFLALPSVKEWKGVTLGEDKIAECAKDKVEDMDFSDLWPDVNNYYDLIYSRHALEHSPFPILTLMEWHRVGSKWLYVVAPAPDFWGVSGQNHYSVMYRNQLHWLMNLAGWQIVAEDVFDSTRASFKAQHSKVAVERMDVEYRVLALKIKDDEDSD